MCIATFTACSTYNNQLVPIYQINVVSINIKITNKNNRIIPSLSCLGKITKKRNLACGMMLECNLKLFNQVVLLAKMRKCTSTSTRHENLHGSSMSTGYLSSTTVDWSEPANMYIPPVT